VVTAVGYANNTQLVAIRRYSDYVKVITTFYILVYSISKPRSHFDT